MPSGVFSILPDNFFSPLAAQNRQHYAALLVLYYRLFQENTRGLERELVIREFMNYLALHRDSLAEEADDTSDDYMPIDDTSGDAVSDDDAKDAQGTLEFNFHSTEQPEGEQSAKKTTGVKDERSLASRFLRRLINSGLAQ